MTRSTRLVAVLAVLGAALFAPSAAPAQSGCPCSVFAPGDGPTGDAVVDSPLEIGMKFRSSQSGYVTGLKFFKQANNTGLHVGHLWSATGQQLAEATFTDESASGWQEVQLSTAVQISADTDYTVSYHSGQGRFANTPAYFTSAVSRPPLTAPAAGNGVYRYGASGFPDQTWNASNYWVDVTFEQTPGDRTAPKVTTVTPAADATGVGPAQNATATFDEAMDAATVTATTFTLKTASGTAVPATVSYDAATRKATLAPSSALAYGTSYTATIKGGAAGVADTAGNRLASDRTWSFTTSPTCPCSIFGSQLPSGSLDDTAVELGTKFRATEDGFITALRFYKLTSTTVVSTGHLWSASGQLLASVTFNAPAGAIGWQEAPLPQPVQIAKDTTYVSSYYVTTGPFAYSPGGLTLGAGSGPLVAQPDVASGGNGVFKYGPDGSFPDQTFNGTNYWADAVFTRLPPADTRPPQVATKSPADGASNVPLNAKITVTFDEPIDRLTLNAGALVLKDAAGNALAGSVTYDEPTRTATLTPTAPLDYGQAYTATLKSGNAGVTDLAGNQLTQDVNWSFNTGKQCPCTVFAPTAGPPAGSLAEKDQPVELGMKFRPTEDGYITRLRFFKQSNNAGTHVGNLWTSSGDLLATATFTGETASGWQEVALPNAVPVVKDTTYVVSYYSPQGYFPFTDQNFFTSATTNAPMIAPASGTPSDNGVYKYGPSGFPNQSYNKTNYWVDATFERAIPPDTRGPVVTTTTPDANATDVAPSVEVTAHFDEQLLASTVTGTTFTLRDAQGGAVAATVSYDAQTRTAKLVPAAPLANDSAYTAKLLGGSAGIKDAAGNPLAADKSWTFTIAGQSPADGPGGPILVVTNPGDKFSQYYAEILRGEGLNAFSLADGPVTAAMLSDKQVVLLATRAVSDAEVATLSSWVSGGGNLIALKPDKKLAGLLGLTDAGGTLAEGYMKTDTSTAPGAGIDGQSLQFHGTADRYTASGAQAIATLYSNATTATANPAVSLRNVGTSGGQAAAFTYDLARSVVYTRQGNPAWAGDKRDGLAPLSIRPNDLFYGAKQGDVQPDWTARDRFAVPQADEQQRLLANLITTMNMDKAPMPRFGYLPRGEKAAIVLTGDDHATGNTPQYLSRLKSYGPTGCSVADWECVRATSYIYPNTPVGNPAILDGYQADGFEIALHLATACEDYTPASLESALSGQLSAFESAFPNLHAPVSNRTHCIVWSDWAGTPKAERRHGIRFDTNYYYKGPDAWVAANGPGLMTGSGFPQRFADLDGTMIDVYQAMTQVTDEMDHVIPTTDQISALLDNAQGAKGYYGVFTVILHSDLGDHERLTELVSEARDRGVPVVSSAQMLDWLDGRNGSSFDGIQYSGGQLQFTLRKSPKARGLEAMVPFSSGTGPLAQLTRGGAPVSWEKRTIKGVAYAVFDGAAGAYTARYATDTSAPAITNVSATADSEGNATVKWDTDEPSSSLVEYGRTTTLGDEVSATALTSKHSLELTGLSPNTTYRFRVTSVDAAGNSATSPATSSAPATFATPAGALIDSRASEFSAGTGSSTYAGGSGAGTDGEVQLQPAVGSEFAGLGLPLGWSQSNWWSGGTLTTSDGALVADGALAGTDTRYSAPQTLEFSAKFEPVNNQGVGFADQFNDYPFAAFTTGGSGDAHGLYAETGDSGGATFKTLIKIGGVDVDLSVPHRFRIEWRATQVQYFIDGATTPVATHTVTFQRQMRPVVSDYARHGGSVKVHWLRMGSYATSGLFTSRVLDSGPAASDWTTLTETANKPSGTAITYQTRSGATSDPDATWSAWQNVGTGGVIASPNARFIQYRATVTTTSASVTPTLQRVAVGFTAGTDRAPVPGTVSLAPAAPTTSQTLTATPSGFSDPDGDPLTYRYRWYRNGTRISGAAANTLNLSVAGNGDGGDQIRVEVYATDGRGAASDAAKAKVTITNTTPTAGTVTITPTTPSTNDVLTATPAGFTDVDGNTLTYRYQWLRNGTAINGATDRKLDLSVAGNGDLNDTIAVDVRADDGAGGLSSAVRATKTITGTNSTPVAGEVSLAPASPRTDQTVTATPSGFREPDGQAMTYTYRWLRNGTVISGQTAASLNLATAGNGDRGDTIRVEVAASDPGGARSDFAGVNVTVANSAPQAGTVTVKPTAPSTDDVVSANATGFTDADSDALTYSYQWLRNGTAIPEATGRTLDLSQPGNGDLNDAIAVDVTALDGSGGTSPTRRGSTTVSGTDTHPVAAFGFEEAAGNTAANDAASPDGTISGAARVNTGKFGRALKFDGTDDIVTVADDPSIDLATGMTLEAWVRPSATTDWRSVIFKESTGGLNYALYANTDADTPAARVFVDADTGTNGTEEIAPNDWTHLAATYDGNVLRLFVNGVQVSSKPLVGEMPAHEGPLTFGANNVWGEQFAGLIDEIRIYNRALTATQITADMGRPVVDGTPQLPTSGPETIGQFAAPQTWPMVPVHLALMSDGTVAAWDGFEAAVNSERRWDPATGQFQPIPTGRNLFCAGHINLQDGRLLVVGGHIEAYQGTTDTNLFNPNGGTWQRGADMSVARWYPTATALPDGRVFVVSGDNVTLKAPNQPVPLTDASNTLPSIYDPATDTWLDMPTAGRRMPLYPFMFVLPNGKLFDAGPDRVTRTLDLNTRQWTTVGTSNIDGHSAVMYRPGKVLKSGTWSDPEFPGRAVTNRAETIDMTAASPSWQETAPMEYQRSYHTLTMLADGKVFANGGQTTTDGVDERTGILGTEIWDPDTGQWTPAASHRRPRLYHSSSVLLPDGRVLLAGGGAFGNARNENSAEIYSPPYLFKGPRPTITSAPSSVGYGGTFNLTTPNAASIRSVSLVRMGSVTHNFDMDQRFLKLNTTAITGGVRVDGPANANVAPPGWYMAFLMDQNGVPSVSKIIQVKQGQDTEAPSTVTGLTASRTADDVTLNWNAATDNIGVTSYRVHRGTTSTFTPSASNRIATVTGRTHTDSNLPLGQYFYKVVAEDAAGNAGGASAAASVTVPDTTAPTVAVSAPAEGATVANSVTLSATATDDVGVANVSFTVDGTAVGSPDTSSPYSISYDTRTLVDGSHTIRAIGRDAAGNQTTSAARTVNVVNAAANEVAAYGFEETTGSTVVDQTGGNDGTLSGASRTTSGRYGRALSLDGLNDFVQIAHTTSLNPGTSGLTVSAWVDPDVSSGTRLAVGKERTGGLGYGLYSRGSTGTPTASVFTTSNLATSATGALSTTQWSHIALTWASNTLRLYVNGTQVTSRSTTGSFGTSTGTLRIGGTSTASAYFDGLVDEVRVYQRALTAAEITADMNSPVRP